MSLTEHIEEVAIKDEGVLVNDDESPPPVIEQNLAPMEVDHTAGDIKEETEAPQTTDETIIQYTETTTTEKPTKPEEDLGHPIHEPNEHDILNGRGASVNAHRGNTKFRALCFNRKPEFEAGNHAAKRRIATEIVAMTKPGRFLKRKQDKGPWYELSHEKALLKACQVMRDFQRPDRVALREMAQANGARKRTRNSESTPGVNVSIPVAPLPPIVENPFGVHDHDVLSGRGAFVNGHVGNQRFRDLAIERKPQFDNGTYADKRTLATEIVGIIRGLDPPGRFLKRVMKASDDQELLITTKGMEGGWEELSDDRAIHKACQVMRDLNRPDRTGDKRALKKERSEKDEDKIEAQQILNKEISEADPILAVAVAATENVAVEETALSEVLVSNAEEVLDKTLNEAIDAVEPTIQEMETHEVMQV